MKKPAAIAVCLLGVAGLYWFTQAGNLEPPGPPDSTMVTLQEIYDRMDGLIFGLPGVRKTGQTGCWDESGNPVDCAGTGQDGEYQAGVSETPRFTDGGDGTVTDNLTGLIWLKNANCFGEGDWTFALSSANTLAAGPCGLTDGSIAGDWRLPNLRELHSLIDYGQTDPALPLDHPFSGVQGLYWSSTNHAGYPDFAWHVNLSGDGGDDGSLKTWTRYVWPVRGGL